MALSPIQMQAVAALASALYDFLPATPHPLAKVRTTFGTVATDEGVGEFWPGGSKLPALQELLDKTLTRRRDRFCSLVLRIVTEGIKRKSRGEAAVTREEMDAINGHILQLGFKIPELHDSRFLSTLPRKVVPKQAPKQQGGSSEPPTHAVSQKDLSDLLAQFLTIPTIMPAQQRGYAFERFLYRLFEVYALSPRPSFKVVGEQIDGSFEFRDDYYLVEAKWQSEPVAQQELLVLEGRVRGHSAFGRGVFFTCSSYSPDGVHAFQKGRAPAIVGFDGQDMYFMLEQKLSFDAVLKRKLRHLADEGEFHLPVQRFLHEMKRSA